MENVCHFSAVFSLLDLISFHIYYEKGVCEDNWGCMHNVFH